MPASSSFVSSFSIASLAQAIAAPFTALTAYSAGAIDEQGNLLKPESSIDPFEYFVIKLKKIFSELPMSYTKARLANYSSAFQYFTEQAKSFGISEIEFIMFMEGYIQGGKLLNEDMGVGAMGGAGAPGSLSTPSEYESKGGVAGYDVRMAAPLFRRTPVEIFDVDPDEFDQFKNAKAWKHIQDSATKRYLQRFQRRNPNGKMALKTKRPDTDEHELYWITYAPKSFMEEYNLNNIDFLIETKESNKEREKLVYDSFGSLLDAKGFKKNSDARKKEDLQVGEYGVFHPSNEKTDIVVHHDLSGDANYSHIETKYQRHVPGRNSTTYDVVVPHSELEIDSATGKSHTLNPSKIIQHFGEYGKSQARKFLRRGADVVKQSISSILKSKGGMMIVGNNKNVHITHNTEEGSDRVHDEALLKHLGLEATHMSADLSKSGNPYLGNIGREGGGEHVKLRVSAPRHVKRNGKLVDTIESQQKNAETLKIPHLGNINLE